MAVAVPMTTPPLGNGPAPQEERAGSLVEVAGVAVDLGTVQPLVPVQAEQVLLVPSMSFITARCLSPHSPTPLMWAD